MFYMFAYQIVRAVRNPSLLKAALFSQYSFNIIKLFKGKEKNPQKDVKR